MKHRSRFYLAASWICAVGCGGESFGLLPVGSVAVDSPGMVSEGAAQDAGGGAVDDGAILVEEDGRAIAPTPAPGSTATKAPDRSLGGGGRDAGAGDGQADALPALEASPALDAAQPGDDAQADAPGAVDAPPPPPPDAGPPHALCCTTGNPIYLVTSCTAGYQCFASSASGTCSVQALADGGQIQTCTSTAPVVGECSAAGASGACADGDYCIASDHSTAGYVHACP